MARRMVKLPDAVAMTTATGPAGHPHAAPRSFPSRRDHGTAGRPVPAQRHYAGGRIRVQVAEREHRRLLARRMQPVQIIHREQQRTVLRRRGQQAVRSRGRVVPEAKRRPQRRSTPRGAASRLLSRSATMPATVAGISGGSAGLSPTVPAVHADALLSEPERPVAPGIGRSAAVPPDGSRPRQVDQVPAAGAGGGRSCSGRLHPAFPGAGACSVSKSRLPGVENRADRGRLAGSDVRTVSGGAGRCGCALACAWKCGGNDQR